MATTKRVLIDELKPGMYVVELDQPWHRTPFLSHRFVIQNSEQIDRLRQSAVREVVIDLTRSSGVDGEQTDEEAAGNGSSTSRAQVDDAELAGDAATSADASIDGRVRLPTTAELESAREIRRQAVASAQRIFEGVNTGVPLDRPALHEVVTGFMDGLLGKQTAFVTQVFLQQMQRFDDNLFAHVVDVCILSLVVGQDRGLDREELEKLGMGALLHDVGHLRLPRNLLRKRGNLSSQEQKLWAQHTQIGQTLLSQAGELPDEILHIVAQHHEHLDGSGYPKGLRAGEISPLSQIVGLIDTYDRLVSTRAGKPPLPPFLAIREVFELGRTNQYDRVLVEQVVHSLGVYPIGSLVKLNTGEQAVVMALNPQDRLKPLLKLVSDSQGQAVKPPPSVDLSDPEPQATERSIVETLDPEAEHLNVIPFMEE